MSRFLTLFVMRKLLIVLLLAIVAAVSYAFVGWTYHPDNRIPPMALHALENDSNLVLYSLDPQMFVVLDDGDLQRLSMDTSNFHGYRILGQTVLSTAESRHVVATTLKAAVRRRDGWIAACQIQIAGSGTMPTAVLGCYPRWAPRLYS